MLRRVPRGGREPCGCSADAVCVLGDSGVHSLARSEVAGSQGRCGLLRPWVKTWSPNSLAAAALMPIAIKTSRRKPEPSSRLMGRPRLNVHLAGVWKAWSSNTWACQGPPKVAAGPPQKKTLPRCVCYCRGAAPCNANVNTFTSKEAQIVNHLQVPLS